MKKFTQGEMFDYGYTYLGMEPVDRELAMLHFARNDYDVYRLYSNDTEGLVEDADEFLEHDDMYGIEKVPASISKYTMDHRRKMTLEQDVLEDIMELEDVLYSVFEMTGQYPEINFDMFIHTGGGDLSKLTIDELKTLKLRIRTFIDGE